MQAHIIYFTHPQSPDGVKRSTRFFFLKVVMLHIKSKGMNHRAPWKHIFCLYTQPQTLGSGQKVKTFFLKVVMLLIKFKGMERRETCKHMFCTFTHTQPLGWIKRTKHFFSEGSLVAYQIKGNGL